MTFVEHVTTWTTMRGDYRRSHVRLSDLVDATMETGRRWTAYEVYQAIAHVPRPTVKRYGHWHYDERHLEAVRAAVREEVAKCHT
jgi:hypothetical protein